MIEIVGRESFNQSGDFLKEVYSGLSLSQKMIPPKYFYDETGSKLFENICLLPEYYLTRSENYILSNYSNKISDVLGKDILLIEPGSGAGEKIRYLIPYINKIHAYMPIEISKEILLRSCIETKRKFPSLDIFPVHSDMMLNFSLPYSLKKIRKIIFFPGSTIGNFSPKELQFFLSKCYELIDSTGGLLLGIDLIKDVLKMEAAYDDSLGVTSSFNLNLLARMNRELSANFDVGLFEHRSFYNSEQKRIEMHLLSKKKQRVRIGDRLFKFSADETIHTESSYKFTIESIYHICHSQGLHMVQYWSDPEGNVLLAYFEKFPRNH